MGRVWIMRIPVRLSTSVLMTWYRMVVLRRLFRVMRLRLVFIRIMVRLRIRGWLLLPIISI